MKKFDIGGNALLLALVIIFVGSSFLARRKPLKTPEKCEIMVVYKPEYIDTFTMLEEYGAKEPTQDEVLYVMSELRIEHPHIAYAQMVLESAHFDSPLAKSNNNYFGMKEPSVRSTVSLGKKNGYASYKNWAWSVLDYALWQQHCAPNLSEEEYFEFLGEIYAEDKEYVEKVKSISRNLI